MIISFFSVNVSVVSFRMVIVITDQNITSVNSKKANICSGWDSEYHP